MKGKILVVDDDASIRELFSTVFTEAEYEVIAAEGGIEALKILQLKDVDVIFLDLKLFGMNGIELCRQIRETKPISIIYAMTGWGPLFEIEESWIRSLLEFDVSGLGWLLSGCDT